ncbi:MAG: phosphopantetheine-binding protein [Chitinophagaceae bacterium]|nr:phosphopantetheine-binding protein [Chitinophagaceae bacterium]
MPLTSNGKINRKTLPVYSLGLPSIVKFTPPVGELETALHSIWKEVLPYDLIGTTHSFFTVGGNSIMAVQIAARVRQLGYTIQPRDIFYYPTIQQLADFLASQKCNSNEPVLATPNPKVSNNRAGSFKYLIAAQKGKTNRTPLYIICGGGGNFFTFLNFIEQLHPDQPVYIMEYPADVESVAILPGNIKTLATLYIQEMLLNNPEGQFVLSGHCIGGVIAFEMAQQLEAVGKTVDKLLIFDSILRTQNEVHPMMVSHQTWPKGKFMGKAFALYQRLCFQLFLFRKHPRFALTYKIQAATKWLKSNLSDSKYDEAFKETKVYDDLKDKFSAAYKKYRLTPFHKQFFVFYAKDQFYFFDKKNNITYKRYEISTEIKERWLQYGRHVQLFDIEGGHNTMFDGAFGGKDLAQKVQQLIGSGTYTT